MRVFGVERHIGTAGLEDGQQANDHLHRPFDCNTHQYLRPDAPLDQLVCQPVGIGIEFGIAQLPVAEHQCRGLRLLRHLRGEQRKYAVDGELAGGRLAGLQQPLPLAGTQQRQIADGRQRVGGHGLQQVQPMARHTLDGGRGEQFAGIGEGCLHLAVALHGIEGELELDTALVALQHVQLKA